MTDWQLPEEFADLSPRRQRKIIELLAENRADAAINAVAVGIKTMNELYGFGVDRLIRLSERWQKDLVEYYAEKDINEERLKEWLLDIGFVFESGHLWAYKDEDGKLHKARKVEKDNA